MKIQVALDLLDIRRAVGLARELCESGLEMVEAGTPLIKMYGMSAVGAIKAACPRAEVVADLKTADVGELEARLAREFGADWGTVLGATNIETIEEFVRAGRSAGLKTAVDLLGVRDALGRAREIMGRVTPDMFVLHVGIDVQSRAGLDLDGLLDAASKLRGEGVSVGIAGGITEREIERIVSGKREVDVVIIGRAIVNDPSPRSKFAALNNTLKRARAGGT